MVISFCGHSHFCKTKEYEERLLAFLQQTVGDNMADMLLGDYGRFDSFAYECCKKYQSINPKIRLVFVSPYFTVTYQRTHLEYQKSRYDAVVYPEIEKVPPKYAIIYRNRYMVEMSDHVVAYVSQSFGGAYATYKYAKAKKKPIYNLADFENS